MAKGMSVRICDLYAPGNSAPALQPEIAALAYKLWLARGFQDGSPQEDWLRAKREIFQRRFSAMAAGIPRTPKRRASSRRLYVRGTSSRRAREASLPKHMLG